MDVMRPKTLLGGGGERLIGALIPVATGDLSPPRPVPMPALPAPALPAGVERQGLVVDTARVDGSGRVPAATAVRALRWAPGECVEVAVMHNSVIVTAVAA